MPTVVIHNEPKQSKHEVDQKFNEMRLAFIPHIEQFVAKHELFNEEEEVGITFAQKGVSSIIAILETPDKKLVLKIPRSKAFSAGEGQFLKVWEEAGVTVPHVEEVGVLHDYPYTIMEYIDAPILGDKYSEEELIEKKVYTEMGQALRLMHTPKADGYGFVVDDKPEFKTATEWLESEDMKKRIDYVDKNNLLHDIQKSLPDSLEIIKQHTEKEGSSYCHDDFGPHNIFATEPITIFDTNPKFNNGYYDLGRYLMGSIAYDGSEETRDQLLEGYFDGRKYNKQALHAYIFLACYMKFPYWHKTEKSKQMKTIRNYLIQNKVVIK